MTEILKLLENNSRLSAEQIATMLGRSVDDVSETIHRMEQDGIITGYHTLINWEKVCDDRITALIELKVALQRGEGFEKIAGQIQQYPQVKSLWLMSGSFDIALIIEGKNIKEIALFVAEKLATLSLVTATATHFVLKTYKEHGIPFTSPEPDERGVIVL